MPAGEPTFDGLSPAGKVVAVSLADNTAAAVTADGAVHVWGPTLAVTNVPESLTGEPVSAVAVGQNHVAAVVTDFRNLTKPTITGTPQVGLTLTATPATLSLTPDAPATGQWYADNDPIAGKTGTTLALDAPLVGKSISYRTTATRGEDTITSASAPVTVTKAGSKVSGKAKVTGKTPKVANKVTITLTVTTAKGVSRAGKVTVRLKGATKKVVTARVNATTGKATVTVRNVKRGRYTAKLAYTGNSGVSGSNGSVKFRV